MIEPIGHDLRVHARSQSERCPRVAEVVRAAQDRQAVLTNQSLEPAGDAVGVKRLTVVAGERQVGGRHGGAHQLAVPRLRLPMQLEHAGRVDVDDDAAAAAVALRRRDHDPVANRGDRLGDRQGAT